MILRAGLVTLVASMPLFSQQPKTYKVDRGDIIRSIPEQAVIEAEKVAEIRVPSLRHVGDASLALEWLVEDGTMVRKGDRLAKIDSEPLQRLHQQQLSALKRAETQLDSAKREFEITQLVQRKEISSAETEMELAASALHHAEEAHLLSMNRLKLQTQQAELAVEKARLAEKKDSNELNALAVHEAKLNFELAQLEEKQHEKAFAAARIQGKLREREVADSLKLLKSQSEYRLLQAQAAVRWAEETVREQQSRLALIEDQIQKTTILAPLDGVATLVDSDTSPALAVGDPVRAGQPLFRVADLSAFRAVTRIPENQIPTLRVGQPVVITVFAFRDRPLKGQIETIAALGRVHQERDRMVRRYSVRVKLEPNDLPLKPDMTASVVIENDRATGVLRIPDLCIIREQGKTYCEIKTSDGRRRREITLGISDGMFVEVKEGLKEGDLVIEQNPFRAQ